MEIEFCGGKGRAMAGKREQPNKRPWWLWGLLAVLVAAGCLLFMCGGFPTGNEPAEDLPVVEETPLVEETPAVEEVPVEEPVEMPEPEEKAEVPEDGVTEETLPPEEEEPKPELPPKDLPLDPEKPMIALTFDDGPGEHTARLLDAFDTYGGKATFFVVGRNINAYKDVLKRAAEEGHEIGSHSWNHPQLTKLGQDSIKEQITRTRDKIQEAAGVEVNLLRPPYGAQNKTVRAIAGEMGIVLINWNVDPKDWQLRNADKVYDAVMNTVKDGDIILCHDIHSTTVDAMERLIPELRMQGYQLVTVTELLTAKGGEMVPGTQYRYRVDPET